MIRYSKGCSGSYNSVLLQHIEVTGINNWQLFAPAISKLSLAHSGG